MILVWIVGFGVLFLCFFYFTVHQAISVSTQKNRLKKLNNAHPNADGIQSHAPQRINKEIGVDSNTITRHDKVILSTTKGDIAITLLPELSPESVAYIHDVVQTGCDRCTFYRVEKPGIFQGMIKSQSISPTSIKGKCPPEDLAKPQECPEHDKNCGCHGPLMTKGMVGWAGGGTGPDFFIDTYDAPATHWGNQHT
jgi:cyclophilin family peptidyl-prolyl cis-trans isomerase